jgi:hypothetical protein
VGALALLGALALAPRAALGQMRATVGEITTTLFIPEGVTKMKGVLAFTPLGLGSGWFTNEDFRALARRLELGVVTMSGEKSSGDDPSYPSRCANGRFKMLIDSLTELGKVSGHPELANAPIMGGGHSHGGDFWNYFNACYPQRMVLVFCKASGGVQYTGAALRTPMIWEIGTNDLIANGNDAFRGIMFAHRTKGSPLTLILGPGEGHGGFTAGSRQLVIDVMEAMWKVRVPADADPAAGPVRLNDVDESSGSYWLGDNYTKEVAAWPMAPGKEALQKTSFLATEALAQKWKAYGANLPTSIQIDSNGVCAKCYPKVSSEPPLGPLNTGPGNNSGPQDGGVGPADAGTAGDAGASGTDMSASGGTGGNGAGGTGGNGGGGGGGGTGGGATGPGAGGTGTSTGGSGSMSAGGRGGSGPPVSPPAPPASSSSSGGCTLAAGRGDPASLAGVVLVLAPVLALLAARRRTRRAQGPLSRK